MDRREKTEREDVTGATLAPSITIIPTIHEEQVSSAGDLPHDPFIPRTANERRNSRTVRLSRLSLKSKASLRSRFARGMSVTSNATIGLSIDDHGSEDDVEGKQNMSKENYSAGSFATVRTTEEQSRAEVLSFLTDPGSQYGSSILLASPSYLDIYAQTIDETIGEELEVILDEVEPMPPAGNEDIFQNPEYINTCQGNLALAEIARMIAKDSKKHHQLFDRKRIRKNRSSYYKRVFVIGISFFLMFSSYYGIRNAQSSLGTDRQLSSLAYGGLYSMIWFGGVCASPMISSIRPKFVMALASIGFVCYPLSNFYPTYYTLLPISVIAGFASGLIWAVEGVYLMNIASAYALISNGELVQVISKFNRVVYTLFLSSNIFGNLLSSLVLGNLYTLPGEEEFLLSLSDSYQVLTTQETTTNYSIISNKSYGANAWPDFTSPAANAFEASQCGISYKALYAPVNQIYAYKKYIFFGINLLLSGIGSLLLFFALKPLEVAHVSGNERLGIAMKKFLLMFTRKRSFFLIPMMCYFGIAGVLVLSNYVPAFVTCQYGAGMVGFHITSAYFFSILGAFTSGKIVMYTGRIPVFVTSAFISLGSVCVMLIWQPNPTKKQLSIMPFIPLWLWGLSDGVLYTQCTGLLGILFKKRVPEALTMQSFCLGVSALLCTLLKTYSDMKLTVLIGLAISVNIIATLSYIILEILLKKNIV